jgi:2'-5' RNA ligase
MRLFVAIELPDEVRERLREVDGRLRDVITRQGVRFVRLEKIHLTLRFIGDVADERVIELVEALRAGTEGSGAVDLQATGLGCFPNLRRPRVVWVGVQGDLQNVASRASEAVAPFAGAGESTFVPHLTLARVSPASQAVGRILEPLADELKDQSFGSWTARKIVLIQSILSTGEYQTVETVSL